MSKNFSFFFVILVLFLISQPTIAVNNNIELKVGNKIVTSYEIKNKILISLIISNQEINQTNINKFKERSIESLIQKKIKEIELDKYNFVADKKKVENYLESISSNNIDKLKEQFEINNLSFELFTEEIETQFKWQQLIYKRFAKNIEIDKESINAEIKKILENQNNSFEFKLSEIEISINNGNLDKKKIDEIKKSINDIGFEETAKKFSNSSSAINNGDLGWINSNILSKKIFEIVKKLNIGQVSEIILDQNTATFLKLNDKKKSTIKKVDIENLRKKLINRRMNEIFELYSQSLVSTLKNSTLIEYIND